MTTVKLNLKDKKNITRQIIKHGMKKVGNPDLISEVVIPELLNHRGGKMAITSLQFNKLCDTAEQLRN